MVVSLNHSVVDTLQTRPSVSQVVLSSKYQIVIPADVRKDLDLKPGQLFDVLAIDGVLHVVRVMELSEAFGAFPGIDTSVPRDDEDRV